MPLNSLFTKIYFWCVFSDCRQTCQISKLLPSRYDSIWLEGGGCNTGDIKRSGSKVLISLLTREKNCLKLHSMGKKRNFKDIWGYERKWQKDCFYVILYSFWYINWRKYKLKKFLPFLSWDHPFFLSPKPPMGI